MRYTRPLNLQAIAEPIDVGRYHVVRTGESIDEGWTRGSPSNLASDRKAFPQHAPQVAAGERTDRPPTGIVKTVSDRIHQELLGDGDWGMNPNNKIGPRRHATYVTIPWPPINRDDYINCCPSMKQHVPMPYASWMEDFGAPQIIHWLTIITSASYEHGFDRYVSRYKEFGHSACSEAESTKASKPFVEEFGG